jgi:hypothetical protein
VKTFFVKTLKNDFPHLINVVFFGTTLFLILNISYNASQWRAFGDAYDYLFQANLPLFSFHFFFPESIAFSSRGFTVPLFYKIVDSDPEKIFMLQKIMLSTSLCLFVASVFPFLKYNGLKIFFACVAYCYVLWWNLLGWTTLVLSESISISLFFCWLASLLFVFGKRHKLSVALHCLAIILFSFTRDSIPYLIVFSNFFVLFICFFWQKMYIKLSASILVFSLIIFGIYQQSVKTGSRYKIPLVNTIVIRIIPSVEYTKWFTAQGMPGASVLKQRFHEINPLDPDLGGKIYPFYTDSTKKEYRQFFEWVKQEGKRTYVKFLVTHPGYSFLLCEKDPEVARMVSYNLSYISQAMGVSKYFDSFFPVFNIGLAALLVFAVSVLFFIRKDFILLVPLLITWIIIVNTLVSYNADAMEVERHALLNRILIEFAALTSAIVILDRLKIKKGAAFMFEKFKNLIQKIKRPISLSGLAIIVLAGTCVYSVFNIGKWKNKDVITWDTISYYSYLPATFIYKDISLNFVDTNKRYYGNKFWPNTAPNGGKVIKTTMGLAILYAPFFAIAHIYANMAGYETDGFSLPYQLLLALSASFYLIFGLFWLRKTLAVYYNDKIISITLTCLVLGTNLLCYTTIESTMSHTFNFALISALIYTTIAWHDRITWKKTIVFGVLCGLIILIRPVNIIILLFPLLYGITGKQSFRKKALVLKTYPKHLLLILFLIVLFFSPQLFYWKYVTGQWFYNSYEGEHFYFNNPHIIEGLFGFRKGWFIYTPLMFFALAAIFVQKARRNLPDLYWAISLFTVLAIFVLLSWWCWWYGGSYGLRAFIDFYSIWAILIAFWINEIAQARMMGKVFLSGFIFFLVALNCFQTYQYKKGIIHWDSMTKAEYIAVFGKLHYPANADLLIESPDYAKARRGED